MLKKKKNKISQPQEYKKLNVLTTVDLVDCMTPVDVDFHSWLNYTGFVIPPAHKILNNPAWKIIKPQKNLEILSEEHVFEITAYEDVINLKQNTKEMH